MRPPSSIKKQQPLILIFDFDQTFTEEHTALNKNYWTALSKEKVEKNVHALEKIQKLVQTAIKNGHHIAIASFNHESDEGLMRGRMPEGTVNQVPYKKGRNLIRHYLEIVFGKETADKIYISAGEPSAGKNKLIGEICNYFYPNSEYNEIFKRCILLDDDINNVREAQGLGLETHWITSDDRYQEFFRDNYEEILENLLERLEGENISYSASSLPDDALLKEFCEAFEGIEDSSDEKEHQNISFCAKNELELLRAFFSDGAKLWVGKNYEEVYKPIFDKKITPHLRLFNSERIFTILRNMPGEVLQDNITIKMILKERYFLREILCLQPDLINSLGIISSVYGVAFYEEVLIKLIELSSTLPPAKSNSLISVFNIDIDQKILLHLGGQPDSPLLNQLLTRPQTKEKWLLKLKELILLFSKVELSIEDTLITMALP